MSGVPRNPRLTEDRLAKRALVYLRQSTERQVQENRESQRLQYALADYARRLGWTRVEVLDEDLGFSASLGSARRPGFQRLLAEVARGDVGAIFSREMSRLSRTDKDWCHLIELCQLYDTLIADDSQLYDVNLMDDQLVLGIKGTLSVVELKTLRMRLQKGMEAKAQRGELIRKVAPGYVRDGGSGIVLDPNVRIQEGIRLIFRKFREIGSVRQTYLWFHAEGIELPVHRTGRGPARIVFKLPTQTFIWDVLRNPIYAGAYVYGRRPIEAVVEQGEVRRRQGRLRSPEEARVFIRDHHEGYISWQDFEEHQRMMRRNAVRVEGDEIVGAVRAGQGLLTGLLRCGRCGRKLHVRYWGRGGTAMRYLCVGDFGSGGRYCQGFGGSTVDRRFSEELLRVVSPHGVEASLRALEKVAERQEPRARSLRRQLEQAEYDVQRAFDQYNESDPRHRLVAAELERRWNAALESAEDVRKQLAALEAGRRTVTEDERSQIRQLGQQFEAVWSSEACPMELKKRIARTLVEEIVVTTDEAGERLHFVIHWSGGVHTELEMEKPQSPVGSKTAMEDLEIIRRMAVRYGDDEIARVLNKLERRTARGKRWSEQRVAGVRKSHSISGRRRRQPDPDILTLGSAVKEYRVSDTSLRRLVRHGILPMHQVAPWAPWELRRADLESEPVSSILEEVRTTGKLRIEGERDQPQRELFLENQPLVKEG